MAEQSSEGNGAAFFDLDKTLMAGSSGMVFARVANRRGFVPRGQLAKWGWDHLRYRLRGSSDEQTNAVVDVAKRIFAEIPERDVERMAPEVLAGILPRVYPQMLDEVHRHQDEGRATFIVSADGPLLEIAQQEDWLVMRFERLGRKLAIAGATAFAAAAGGLAAGASKRRNTGRRLKRWRESPTRGAARTSGWA